ncbi:hypothetical protein IFR05_016970 [Cadophora sp. M221]|nr:hypothetical protein IFR05_016970 [Cadophora sp. M221]
MPATEGTPLLRGGSESSSLPSTDGDAMTLTPVDVLDKWRIAATFFGFLILRQYYHANYLTVSVLLLSPVVGYTIAAFTNNAIHNRYGQRGIAIIGPGLHVIAFLAVALHPPYQVLILVFVLAGLGSGLVDAGWNAWIGSMPDSSGIMGSLHSFYGLGAALAPVIANTVITKLGWGWYGFYYLMALASVIELSSSTAAFFSKTGDQYRLHHGTPSEPEIVHDQAIFNDSLPDKKRCSSPVLQALRNPSTMLISMFIFLYAGIEISLADWIMTLAVDHRAQTPFAGSMLTFAFWGGLTSGRIIIGFLIPLIGNSKGVITSCLIVTILSHLVFTLRSDLVTSAVVVPLLGFSLGPLFPEAVIMQTRLVDRRLHVAAVGFACALGSAGGCVFPFLVGVIANSYDITSFIKGDIEKFDAHRPSILTDQLRSDIQDVLSDKARCMFKWAQLTLKFLLDPSDEEDEAAIQENLDHVETRPNRCLLRQMAEAYEKLYKKHLPSDIDKQVATMRKAEKVLGWIFVAARPLRLYEILCLADENYNGSAELRKSSDQSILKACRSFLFISEESRTVEMSHSSVETLLQDAYNMARISQNTRVSIDSISYLLSTNSVTIDTWEIIDQQPLIPYTAEFWSQHANLAIRQANKTTVSDERDTLDHIPDAIRTSIRSLLNPENQRAFENWLALYSPDQGQKQKKRFIKNLVPRASGQQLYYAMILGFWVVARDTIDDGWDVDAVGGYF